MNQTQSKKFHCTYLLHFFPFDSQVCNVIFEIEQFSAESVELVPHQIQMLSPTELTQYFIQSWVLDYNDKSWFKSYIIHGCVLMMSFRYAIQGDKNADCFQEKIDKWASYNLSSNFPTSSDIICNHLLQTILFWGSCNCQFDCHACDNNFVYQVKFVSICCRISCTFIPVLWESCHLLLMFALLTSG